MLMRKGIKHYRSSKYEMNHIQEMNISVECWDGNLTIAIIHCTLGHTIKEEQYSEFIDFLQHM
jgi:hypothetical protein